MKNKAHSFLQNLFIASNTYFLVMTSHFTTIITPQDNIFLNTIPSIQEIPATVFAINPIKASGPDGYTSRFF